MLHWKLNGSPSGSNEALASNTTLIPNVAVLGATMIAVGGWLGIGDGGGGGGGVMMQFWALPQLTVVWQTLQSSGVGQCTLGST